MTNPKGMKIAVIGGVWALAYPNVHLHNIDMLLLDLGLSPYRKLPNIFAEIFDRYTVWDYHDVLEDYERKRAVCSAPLTPQPFDT